MGTFAGTATFNLVGSYTKASDLSTLTEAINYSNSPTSYANAASTCSRRWRPGGAKILTRIS